MATQLTLASEEKLFREPLATSQPQTFDEFMQRLVHKTDGVAKALRRVMDAAKESGDFAAHSQSLYERYLVTTRVIAFSEGASEAVLQEYDKKC